MDGFGSRLFRFAPWVLCLAAGCNSDGGLKGPSADGGGGGGGNSGDLGGSLPDLAVGASGGDLGVDNPDAIQGLGKCVEVAGGQSVNGTAIQLGDCSGAVGQHWLLAPDGTIRSLGKCLDVTGGATTAGTPVQLYDCNGSGAQEWRQTSTGAFITPIAKQCLTATGGASASGTRLQISPCTGSAAQSWTTRLHPITSTRVVVYYQTQFNGTTYVPPGALTSNGTRVSDVLVAAFHLQTDLTVHLNDDPPESAKFTQMWSDLHAMQASGVRISAMIGGAAKGSFQRLDQNFASFYPLVKKTIDTFGLDGVDLDVEEAMSLAGIEKVIRQLRTDYGDGFVVTLAPVGAALGGGGNLSGFSYAQLYADLGGSISWLNAQLYNGWGSIKNSSDYDTIVGRGVVPAQKLIAGALSNGANGSSGFVDPTTLTATLKNLVAEHPELGGVASWEYFNSLPGGTAAPWQWASNMATAMGR